MSVCQYSITASEALLSITQPTQRCDQASESAYASPRHCFHHVAQEGDDSYAQAPAVEAHNVCVN